MMDFRDQWTVRAIGHGRGGKRRHIGQARQLGQCRDMAAQHVLLDVAHQLEQAALVVDQQHDGVVGIDHRGQTVEIGGGAHGGLLKWRLPAAP